MVSARQAKRLEAQRQLIQHIDSKIPNFTDLFDERTFYISFSFLCVFLIIIAIFLSYCCNVTIHDAEELARQREHRKRQKQKKLAEKLLKKKIAKYEEINGKPMDPEKIAKLDSFLKKFDEEEKNQSEIEDLKGE